MIGVLLQLLVFKQVDGDSFTLRIPAGAAVAQIRGEVAVGHAWHLEAVWCVHQVSCLEIAGALWFVAATCDAGVSRSALT
jgi:hypothetical protein